MSYTFGAIKVLTKLADSDKAKKMLEEAAEQVIPLMEKYKFKVVSLERPTPEVHEMMGKNGYWFMTSLPFRGGRPTKSGKKYSFLRVTSCEEWCYLLAFYCQMSCE